MSESWQRVKRGRQNGDPVGSEKPRGKDKSQQKGRFDGGFTPTEQRLKDSLMKQFCRLEGPSGNSVAYLTSSLWCRHPGCHRTNGTHTHKEGQ